MRKILKLWVKERNNVAVAGMVISGVWFLSALNCADEDPNLEQMLLSGFCGLYWVSRGIKWSNVYKS